MTIPNNKKVLIKKSFNISRKLVELINGFNFTTNPKDGIKNVTIKTIKISSLSDSQNLTLEVNDNKKNILDTIKESNLSINKLVIKEIGLDVIFYDGFSDKKKRSELIKINYFDQNRIKSTNPIIDKYLEYWGLTKAGIA